jgi:hypothetical protein
VHRIGLLAAVTTIGLAVAGCDHGHQAKQPSATPSANEPLRSFSLPTTPVPARIRGVFDLHRFALEAHKVADLPSGKGRLVFWASPARGGGWCSGLQRPTPGPWNLSVHCQWPKPQYGPASFTSEGPSLYYGRVTVKSARELRIILDDGQALKVPLRDGFFLYRIPVEVLVQAAPKALVVYDAGGRELGRQRLDYPAMRFEPGVMGLQHPPGGAILARKHELLRRASRAGLISIWQAPSWAGRRSRCWWMQIRRIVVGGECQRIEREPRSLGRVGQGLFTVRRTPLDVLWGRAGRDVAGLVLRFQDGGERKLSPTHGFFLYPIARENMVQGRRPAYLIAHGRDGRPIAKRVLLTFTLAR